MCESKQSDAGNAFLTPRMYKNTGLEVVTKSMQIQNVKSLCAYGKQTKNESSDESIQTSTARNYTCSTSQPRACHTGFVTYKSSAIKIYLGQIHIYQACLRN